MQIFSSSPRLLPAGDVSVLDISLAAVIMEVTLGATMRMKEKVKKQINNERGKFVLESDLQSLLNKIVHIGCMY